MASDAATLHESLMWDRRESSFVRLRDSIFRKERVGKQQQRFRFCPLVMGMWINFMLPLFFCLRIFGSHTDK